MRRALGAALIMTLFLGACSTEGDGADGTGTPEPGTIAPTATSPEVSASPTEDEDPADLPGEVFELYPYQGAELGVVGVGADDTLTLHAGPGADAEPVLALDPLATGLVATGHNRQLDDDTVWAEVTVDGVTGWADVVYLSHLGLIDDITSQLDELPSGPDLAELAERVAAQRATEDGPSPIITVVDGPTVGDLGEVTVDLLGLGDDAQRGERLHVFAVPDDAGFTVRTVEATVLCGRGVTTDGLCV